MKTRQNFSNTLVVQTTVCFCSGEAGAKKSRRVKDPVFFPPLKGTITVGKSTVQLADVTAGNGVVHVIDDVLFPEDDLDLDLDLDLDRGPDLSSKDLFSKIAAVPRLFINPTNIWYH